MVVRSITLERRPAAILPPVQSALGRTSEWPRGSLPQGLGAKRHIEKPARWRQDLSGTIAQRLNLEHQIHHTVSKLCILAFEPLK
jgi:hypothetical protein